MLLSSSSLTGNDVKNPEGDKLGKIEDFMIDTNTGDVAYGVLSFGGVFGMFDKLFAVPITAMTVDTENKCFLLNQSKARLEGAPGFNKDDWPDTQDLSWRRAVDDYYRIQ
jgi:sporulation protein YlmC with PRC-barrel domain